MWIGGPWFLQGGRILAGPKSHPKGPEPHSGEGDESAGYERGEVSLRIKFGRVGTISEVLNEEAGIEHTGAVSRVDDGDNFPKTDDHVQKQIYQPADVSRGLAAVQLPLGRHMLEAPVQAHNNEPQQQQPEEHVDVDPSLYRLPQRIGMNQTQQAGQYRERGRSPLQGEGGMPPVIGSVNSRRGGFSRHIEPHVSLRSPSHNPSPTLSLTLTGSAVQSNSCRMTIASAVTGNEGKEVSSNTPIGRLSQIMDRRAKQQH